MAFRRLGIQVVHAPSDVLGPYKNTPQRKAMQAIADEDWVLAWNIGDDLHTEEHVQAALRVRASVEGRGRLRSDVRVRSRRLPMMVSEIRPLFFAMITS